MARRAALLLCLCAAPPLLLADAGAAEAAVTPIQKVVTLMQDMLAKGEKEKKEEAVKFSAFSQWCVDQTRIKTNEIQAGQDKMEALQADIDKAASVIRKLTDRIDELGEDVDRWAKDMKSIKEVRDKEAADYEATLQDYSESISALTEAIAVLKKQAYHRPQTELAQALIQVRRQRLVPSSAKEALAAYVQEQQPSVEAMPDDRLSYEAPEAYAYEFQSGGVVDMLGKLLDDFSSKKSIMMKEELQASHAFQQMTQQLTDNTENAKHEIKKKSVVRAETQQAKAQAEGDLAQTTKDMKEDQAYLETTTSLCQQKSDDFKSRQDLRGEELATIQKAIELISSDAVAGAGDRHLPSLLQLRAAAAAGRALAQARSGARRSPAQERVRAFLAERARASGSELLAQVVESASQNPFGKVKKLIKDLIVQLMEEGTSETEHKGWCDTELTTNKQTRDRKTADVNALTAEIEDLNSDIAQLTQDIADLAAAVQELDEAMAAAADDRASTRATNEQTIQEAKEAQVAVENAMAVIKDFYQKSAQATALAQQTPAEDAPETFDKPYKGMLPEGGNVVDFLEVILTDFTRLESETSASEAAEQAQFEKFMFESKKDKALKENESKHKQAKKTDKEGALHAAEEELKTTQGQLNAALKYYQKLKPTCVDSGISYEERVKRRQAEMQSLQEALQILSGEDVAA